MNTTLDDFEVVLNKAHQELRLVEGELKNAQEYLDNLDQEEYERFRNFMWRLAHDNCLYGLNAQENIIQTPIRCRTTQCNNVHYVISLVEDKLTYNPTYSIILRVTSNDDDILTIDDTDDVGDAVITKTYEDFKKQSKHVIDFYIELMSQWDYAKEFITTSFIKVANNDMACMLECAEDELQELKYGIDVVEERLGSFSK